MAILIRMMAAMTTWVCPRCKLTQQYEGSGIPNGGIPKCPKCGIMMSKK